MEEICFKILLFMGSGVNEMVFLSLICLLLIPTAALLPQRPFLQVGTLRRGSLGVQSQ